MTERCSIQVYDKSQPGPWRPDDWKHPDDSGKVST